MKSHSKAGIERWIKSGDYERREIWIAAISKEEGSYAPGGSLSDSLTKTTKKEREGIPVWWWD